MARRGFGPGGKGDWGFGGGTIPKMVGGVAVLAAARSQSGVGGLLKESTPSCIYVVHCNFWQYKLLGHTSGRISYSWTPGGATVHQERKRIFPYLARENPFSPR